VVNKSPEIAVKELVLVGGGHSHVGLIKMFAMNPLPGLRLTLIASDTHTPYSGMLPGFIAGQYTYDDIHLDLRVLSEFAHCRLYHAKVTHIDTEKQLIYSDQRPPIKYDLLSINIGSTPDDFDIPGVRELTVPVKPVKPFISQLEHLTQAVLNYHNIRDIVVVGGGASGVELILSIQYRLEQALSKAGQAERNIHYTLFSAAQTILPSHNSSVQKRVLSLFKKRGICLHLGASIKAISQAHDVSDKWQTKVMSYRHCSDSTVEEFSANAIIWSTTASSAQWPRESGLAVDKRGFIQVNDYLQSLSHSNIFATGDIASMVNNPRPKSGVYAVRQGPPLFENIRRFACGQGLKPYKPQKNFLSLLNCADKTAIASRGFLAFEGHWVWQYKNWIDVNFMKLFSDLPDMAVLDELTINKNMLDANSLKQLQEIPMRCGGCGAKVGSRILSRVLERLQSSDLNKHKDSTVILGLEHSDDAAVIAVPEGQLLVQSLDYFKSFINDPFLLGKIAANHALGDLFAMGAKPHSALALVTLPYALSDILEEELFLIMSGALEVLNDNNMTLVGGHTGEGADMSFGLNVNGFVRQEDLMSKAGLNDKDVLILTKPLGTGTLLAANMRYKAKGRWVDNVVEQMLVSNDKAAQIFQKFNVRACTDITGFGLLGHLFEMLRASRESKPELAVQLDMSALPVLKGAHDMLQAGIVSSLQDENLQFQRILCDDSANNLSNHPNYPLLFDPQTAGGLLASVASDQADSCLAQLHATGYQHATIIGYVNNEVVEQNKPSYFVKLLA